MELPVLRRLRWRAGQPVLRTVLQRVRWTEWLRVLQLLRLLLRLVRGFERSARRRVASGLELLERRVDSGFELQGQQPRLRGMRWDMSQGMPLAQRGMPWGTLPVKLRVRVPTWVRGH
jgi:hypothetical protein